MIIRSVNHHFSVSGPLSQADIKHLAQSGVAALINGRPDFEEPGQTPNATISTWAVHEGLRYYFVPVKSGHYSDKAIDEFGDILMKTTGRVHAICRTGTRVLHLWALARIRQGSSVAEVLQMGNDAGVDFHEIIDAGRN